MMHPTRVHGIVTVNNTATESLGRFTDRLKVQQLWSISERFISFIGQTQCFEERPEGWSERKASVPMVMDGCQKMQNYYSQECGQFRRSIQEEERVHDRAQQSNQVLFKTTIQEEKRLTLTNRCDVLLITGMKSKYVGDTEAIHREMKPGLCSIIKARRFFLKTSRNSFSSRWKMSQSPW